MSIRVALVAPTLQILGGHSVQAARLLETWRGDRAVTMRLVPINPAPPRILEPLRKVRFLRTALTQLCYWPLLLRALRRADVVHVFSPSNSSFFRSSLPAILMAKLHHKPVVVNYRGDGREHLSRSRMARRILSAVDVIVVPSIYFHEIFSEFKLPSQIVPNVTDLMSFRYRPRDPLRPRFISTRNFERIYNVHCTLRAFARVQEQHPDASLVLVGSGSEERALRRLTTDLGLRSVTFAGAVPPSAISAQYDAADLYVQTPRIDNMPASLLEAFASGLPAVSTAVGGVPALLEDGVNGLLAPSDDDAAVARQMMYLLLHPAEAREMAVRAAAVSRAFEASVVREQWRGVYSALAGWIAPVESGNHVAQN